MSERTGYRDGEPCWADVQAPDVDAAKRFYTGLFGWSYEETGPEFGNYAMAVVDGRRVAGVSPPAPGAERVPPIWSTYLCSHDLDETARRIGRYGGRLMMGPMEVPGSGRMLSGVDPTGVAFGVWEPGGHTGAQLFDQPGAMCWTELNTREPAAADTFYEQVFGYRQAQIGDGEQFDYTAWDLGGDPVCGRLAMTDQWDGVPAHWMIYFAVDDVDAALGRVSTGGGQVQHGPFDSPHGRIAVVVDPHGADFTIIDRSRSVGV